MSAFLDRYHDAFHTGTTVDLLNCPWCQDEFIAWHQGTNFPPQGHETVDPVTGRCVGPNDILPPVDRMEDLPQYEGNKR